MQDTLTTEPSPEEAKELEDEIRRMFQRMAELDQNIRHNQAEIDRFKKETRGILDTLKVA